MRTEKLLITRDLWAHYGEQPVLRGLSLEVGAGETVAIMGESGCGKSTLLRILAALQEGSGGEVVLDGQTIMTEGAALFEEWEIRRQIMLVQQNPALLPHLTAAQNVAVGLQTVKGLTRKASLEHAVTALDALGIGQFAKRYPVQLSGGQAQRVQLARTMVLQPQVLLLDEVTAHLDESTAEEVMNALWTVRKLGDSRQAIIVVTHSSEFARKFADRVLVLEGGVLRKVQVTPVRSAMR